MRTIPWISSVVALAIAACGGTVISTGDDQIMGQGGAAGHGGGSQPDASVSKGGSPGQGGNPGLSGTPGQGGSPGLGGNPGWGGAAGCGDLSSDPKNCGACFHDCQGGDCVAGFCQPVEIGQAGPGDPIQLLVDETHLFLGYGDGALDLSSSVSRIPKAGGALEEILPPNSVFWEASALLGDSVYLLRSGQPASRILRLPKSGGPTSVVWEGEESLSHRLVADAEHLFFGVEGKETAVLRLSPVDNTSQVVTTLPSGTWQSVGIDESFAYVMALSMKTGMTLYRAPKFGGDFEVILEESQMAEFALDSASLYYVTTEPSYPWGPSHLLRIPKAGGTPESVIDESADRSIAPIAFDGDRIWYLRREYDAPVNTDVMVTPVAGGLGTLVITEVVRSTFASDETFLYWVRDSGAIMRMVR